MRSFSILERAFDLLDVHQRRQIVAAVKDLDRLHIQDLMSLLGAVGPSRSVESARAA